VLGSPRRGGHDPFRHYNGQSEENLVAKFRMNPQDYLERHYWRTSDGQGILRSLGDLDGHIDDRAFRSSCDSVSYWRYIPGTNVTIMRDPGNTCLYHIGVTAHGVGRGPTL
jgi:hypothetical protein